MSVNFPKTSFSIVRGQSLLTDVEQRALIVGNKLDAGSAAAGVLAENVGTSISEINGLFGARSHVAELVRAFREINGATPLDVLPLDDVPGATAATGAVGFSGTATETGTLDVSVGSAARYKFKVAIGNGDTATEIGATLSALVAAKTSAPFTAADNTGDVTFTASTESTIANDWMIQVEGEVAGVTATITAFSGGLTDPTLTGVFAAVGNVRYQTVVWPGAYSLTPVESFLDGRFNADGELLQGVAIACVVDSVNNALTTSDALQSQSMVVLFSKDISRDGLKGGQHKEIPDVLSAKLAALRSLRFTDGASLSQFLSTSAGLDQFGSRALATLPYANTLVPGIPVISPIDDLTRLEMDTLREGGLSTIGPNRNFSAMVLSEIVTSSNKNLAGDPDDSFKFLNTVDAVAAVRDAFFINSRRRFAQSRLTSGDLIAGRDMVNADSFRAFTEEVYFTLAEDGIVSNSIEDLAEFKRTSIIIVSTAQGRISFSCEPRLVTGLRAILGTIEVNIG